MNETNMATSSSSPYTQHYDIVCNNSDDELHMHVHVTNASQSEQRVWLCGKEMCGKDYKLSKTFQFKEIKPWYNIHVHMQ